jgi:endo-1,4-beta-xylanase
MDVALPLDATGALLDQVALARQADIYRFVANACLQQPRCTAFQTWGFTDKYTWVPGFTKGAKGAPLLFDQVYATKPSYTALLNVLKQGRASAP